MAGRLDRARTEAEVFLYREVVTISEVAVFSGARRERSSIKLPAARLLGVRGK